jgi:biopolymer transport protein ExbD
MMRRVCLNSWQPDGCEWSVGYVWRRMNWIVHLDVILLALMLVCVGVVAARIFYRYHLAPLGGSTNSAGRGKIAAVACIQLGILKAIASSAPYLGLAGTCIGIMSGLRVGGIDLEKNDALALISSRLAVALVTTAAGILVAVPATCSYNYLCTRTDWLGTAAANESSGQVSPLSLTKRFCRLPAFGLIAAPGLAILVAACTPYFAPREPTGLAVDLASICCESDGDDRPIVLHITNTGKIFLNTEEENWRNLAGRLSEVYSMREHRTLYLLADDEVSFQTLADVTDIAESASSMAGTEPLDIKVQLITTAGVGAHCLQSVVPRPTLHGSR